MASEELQNVSETGSIATGLTKSQKKNKKKREKAKGKKGSQKRDEGFVVKFLESMVTPGVDETVTTSLNWIFLVLFIVLITMTVVLGSIHYAVMLFLAGGLFLSIQFFLMEASRTPGILNPTNKEQ